MPSSRLAEHPRRGPFSRTAKSLARGTALLLVLPRLVAYWLAASLVGREQAFSSASESIARIPGLRGVYQRQAFYRRSLASCGRDVYFGWQSVFSKPSASVGEGVYIGRNCSIGWVDLGARTLLADGVQILSGGHQHGEPGSTGEARREQPQEYRRVTIGHDCWLGTNAVVMADVGDSSVVGAGAVVNRGIPARSLAVGVPARVVRKSDAPPTAE